MVILERDDVFWRFIPFATSSISFFNDLQFTLTVLGRVVNYQRPCVSTKR